MAILIKLSLLLFACAPIFTTAETITLSEDDADFFHHVRCTSDAAASATLLEADTETYKEDIAKLKQLANKSKPLAIAAGKTSGRKEAYVLQFIELKTQGAIAANKSFIQKRGFDAFAKVAASSTLKMCNIEK